MNAGRTAELETQEALDVRVAKAGDLTDGALSSFLFWKLPAVVTCPGIFGPIET